MCKSAINTVVFDLDGTLLDTLDDLTDSVNYALEKNDMPVKTREQIRSYVGNGIKALISRSIKENTSEEDKARVTDDFVGHYEKNCKNKTKPYDGIVDVLKRLDAEGYKIAIVSNKYDLAVKKLAEYYFGGISVTAIGENEKLGIAKKPAPEMVYEALRILGSDAKNAVYIGDSDVDLKTAENSGLPCISVTWGFRTKEQLLKAGATLFAEKPKDLKDIIKMI